MQSPVFQAEWNDGTVTRMSVRCDAKLDLGRAVRLSWHAYDSRHKGEGKATVIANAHFERNGSTLETYENLKPGDYFKEPKP
jgi:hypothetical protein